MIELSKIRTDGGTQSRAAINQETVAEYAEVMRQPETVFPPVVVYFDGKEYWLADGFHRVEAWREIGRVEIPADVRQGDRRQAVLHSCAANAAHGLRRTNDDKRRAVMTLLEDDEWSKWSDREIARRCGVTHPFVSKLRNGEGGNGYHPEPVADHETPSGDTQAPLPVTDETQPAHKSSDTSGANNTGISVADHAAGGPASSPEPHRSQTGAEPEPQSDPYGYAKLNEWAWLELANGLRADLDDEKAKRKKAEADNRYLKGRLKEHTSDKDESIRRQASQISHQRSEVERANQKFAAEKNKTYALNKEIEKLNKTIAKLRHELEAQEVPL